MSGRQVKKSALSRSFACPRCGAAVRTPLIWALGVESVFVCPRCGLRFKTGFKTGAMLSALALTGAVGSVNLGAYILSSYSIPLMALALIPLWLLYGFLLRRRRVIRRAKKYLRRTAKNQADG